MTILTIRLQGVRGRVASTVARTSWLVGLLAALAALGPGCGAAPRVQYEERMADTSREAVHGVHSDRLSELMGGLARLQAERLPQAMDVGIEERRRAQEIAGVARSMARSGEQIAPAAQLQLAGLDDSARTDFQRLADALVRSANQLAEDAVEVDAANPVRLDELRARLGEIESICHQCHSQFRIPRALPE